MFGPWVEFGQGGNGILLEARDLDAPLPGSDPAMARHLKQYLEPILSQADATLSERGWVVYDLLVSHHAFSDQVASRLDCSKEPTSRNRSNGSKSPSRTAGEKLARCDCYTGCSSGEGLGNWWLATVSNPSRGPG